MKWQTFKKRYQPIENKFCAEAPYDGTMFETYDNERLAVLILWQLGLSDAHVWTLVTGEDNSDVLVSGFHYVNRLGYFICKTPAKEKDFQITLTD